MTNLTQELIELLTLERLEDNLFRGQSRNLVGKRVFGGQVLGQALRAASYTTDRPAHSLHAYFLYGGDINAPIVYEVQRIRDGKSFTNRQVNAIQHGRVIFSAMVSFAEYEQGLDYQMNPPTYPAPETLKNEQQIKQEMVEFVPENVRTFFMRDRHVEIRPINLQNPFRPEPSPAKNAHYLRTHEPLSTDDVALHQAIVAFYSDFILMTTALRPHGMSLFTPNLQCASIDHTIYFHRPLRADDWMLYDIEATTSSNSRGLNFGKMFQNGELVASTVQEGLMRLREIEI
ncbi:acyl-CoA thioesterase II [Moraxella sp. ZY210820]|uniref:acyl-CoA thioesterase n=1 Tax=unclassified Moraxella TaxID=2685852 RepID=UPI0027307AEE|nr:acyl-CoA thioesterase II [Moraxella sp. ZY210820]WLF83846.1 acyl-CoA thioesterase II [Moraxella sp. ZY210820]